MKAAQNVLALNMTSLVPSRMANTVPILSREAGMRSLAAGRAETVEADGEMSAPAEDGQLAALPYGQGGRH